MRFPSISERQQCPNLKSCGFDGHLVILAFFSLSTSGHQWETIGGHL